jgi:uncharacterized protein YhbP (UPF0306 family)
MDLDIEKIVREYIEISIHMSLGTSIDNKPWVSEVHFVYDENLNLYWRSKVDRRHSLEIAENPNVAGNMVKQHKLDEYPHAIYFEGVASLVTDTDTHKKIYPLFHKRLGAEESIINEAFTSEGHKFYMIKVENWYAFGKFGKDSGQKFKLEWYGGASN